MSINDLQRLNLELQKAMINLRESPLINLELQKAEEIRRAVLGLRESPLIKRMEEMRRVALGIQRLKMDSKALVAGARAAARFERLVAAAVRQREAKWRQPDRRRRYRDRHFFRVADNQGSLFYPGI